jgi:hypothetical protein
MISIDEAAAILADALATMTAAALVVDAAET